MEKHLCGVVFISETLGILAVGDDSPSHPPDMCGEPAVHSFTPDGSTSTIWMCEKHHDYAVACNVID